MNDEQRAKSTTTDGKPPRPGLENAAAPAPLGADGMHEAYWVLSEEERAKGFVRPVRRSYVHVGRSVCGKPKEFDGRRYVCVLGPDHAGDCCIWSPVQDAAAQERALATHRLGGCGTVTTMGVAIAETYARQPDYYGSTFCCRCGTHAPVGEHGEFVWEGTEERVGT